MKKFYAIELAHGHMRNRHGLLIGEVYSFPTSHIRNAWIDARPRDRLWLNAVAPEVRHAKKAGICIHLEKPHPERYRVSVPFWYLVSFQVTAYSEDDAINQVHDRLNALGGMAFKVSGFEGSHEYLDSYETTAEPIEESEQRKAS